MFYERPRALLASAPVSSRGSDSSLENPLASARDVSHDFRQARFRTRKNDLDRSPEGPVEFQKEDDFIAFPTRSRIARSDSPEPRRTLEAIRSQDGQGSDIRERDGRVSERCKFTHRAASPLSVRLRRVFAPFIGSLHFCVNDPVSVSRLPTAETHKKGFCGAARGESSLAASLEITVQPILLAVNESRDCARRRLFAVFTRRGHSTHGRARRAQPPGPDENTGPTVERQRPRARKREREREREREKERGRKRARE